MTEESIKRDALRRQKALTRTPEACLHCPHYRTLSDGRLKPSESPTVGKCAVYIALRTDCPTYAMLVSRGDLLGV